MTKLASNYVTIMEACAAYVANVKPDCNTSTIVYQVLQPIIAASTNNQQEAFYVIMLDHKMRMLQAPVEIFKGVASACYCSSREIFQKALMANAVSIIIAHNHPSGDPEPSTLDISTTKKLIDAGNFIGIPVIDHVICGSHTETNIGFVSLRERANYLFQNNP
jgi:DNA repair protein RadC